jgi:hypothetical protein
LERNAAPADIAHFSDGKATFVAAICRAIDIRRAGPPARDGRIPRQCHATSFYQMLGRDSYRAAQLRIFINVIGKDQRQTWRISREF